MCRCTRYAFVHSSVLCVAFIHSIRDVLETRKSAHFLLSRGFPSEQCNIPRYKIVVQVTLGQMKDQGVRVASRCLWDTQTDNYASVEYSNVGHIHKNSPFETRPRTREKARKRRMIERLYSPFPLPFLLRTLSAVGVVVLSYSFRRVHRMIRCTLL